MTYATSRELIAMARSNALVAIEDLIRRLLEDAEQGPAVSSRERLSLQRRAPATGSGDRRLRRIDGDIAALRAALADTTEAARIRRRLDELEPLRAAMAAIDAGQRAEAGR